MTPVITVDRGRHFHRALPFCRGDSLDDSVRSHQQIWRDCQSDLLRGVQIYHQLELLGLLNGQVEALCITRAVLEQSEFYDGRRQDFSNGQPRPEIERGNGQVSQG